MESIIIVFYHSGTGEPVFKKEYEAEELYLPRNGEFVRIKDYAGFVFKVEHFIDKEEIYVHVNI